jgi:ferredoxin-type protein NapH
LVTGSIITIDILIGVFIILVFYSLIVGRSFCSWVCPINIVTDTASWLRNKGFSEKKHHLLQINKNTRYYVLVIALILSLLMGVAAYEVLNPIGFAVRGVVFGFGMGGFILFGIFLFDLLVLKNGFCGHLCPIGAMYSFLSRYRLLKVYLDNDKCTSCMDCKKVCPEVQVLSIIGKNSGSISQGACTNCGRCIEVCDDKALKFTIKLK